MVTHSSFLPGESHGQRSLAGYSPKGPKELNMTKVTELQCSHAFFLEVPLDLYIVSGAQALPHL